MGRKFGPEYVNKLYGMARRHVTGISAWCVLPITLWACALRWNRAHCRNWAAPPGAHYWQVAQGGVVGEEVGGLSGPALFIDLDSVIIDNIDGYFTHGSPDDVILARNWAKPFSRMGQTSIFRFPIGKNPQILANFRRDPRARRINTILNSTT